LEVPVVLIACWSAKGGAGTTVVATVLALLLARREPGGTLLADFAGDVPAVLGVPEPDSPGLVGWLEAGASVPADALSRLEVRVAPGLSLLPRGAGALLPERSVVLASLFENSARHVVADCGSLREPPATSAATALAHAAGRSWLVIRPCYLSLRHATAAPSRPSAAVIVQQPGRSLGRSDVERVLDVPAVALLEDDPAVARAVDAGLLSGRIPRSLERGMRHVV
jgi:hypothetical protein